MNSSQKSLSEISDKLSFAVNDGIVSVSDAVVASKLDAVAGGVLSVADATAADAAYVADSALGAAAVDAAHAEAISFGEGVVSRSIFARNDDTEASLYFSLDGGTSYGVLAPGEYISCDIARASIKLYGSGEPQYLVIASYRAVA